LSGLIVWVDPKLELSFATFVAAIVQKKQTLEKSGSFYGAILFSLAHTKMCNTSTTTQVHIILFFFGKHITY